MARVFVIAFCSLTLATLASPTFGQGILLDGVNGRFEWNPTAGTNGSADLQPDSGTDHLFQFWWYHRVDGAGMETPFPWFPTNQTYVGNVATITESFADFDSMNVTTLTEGANPGECTLTSEMTITNTGAAALDIHIYNYLDPDVSGSFGNDSATLVSPELMAVTDPGGDSVDYRGQSADHYQVLPFAALRALLEDGFPDDLNDTGLPFGPADFTGAWQWDLVIAAGDSVTLCATVGVNLEAPTCEPPPIEFIRGDFNNDGVVNFLVDAVFGLNAGFVPGSDQPACLAAADANGDRAVNFLVDSLFMLNAGFVIGSDLPPFPYPDCGIDPNTIAALGCDVPTCP